MRILLLTNSYPPEIGGHANLCHEMAQGLSARGHSIVVVTRYPRYLPPEFDPKIPHTWLSKVQQPEANVIRIKIPELNRRIPFVREFDYLLHIFFLAIACFQSGLIDIIWTSSPPQIMGYVALIARFFCHAKVVLNIQDLFPQNLIDIGTMSNKHLIALCRLLEKDLYKRSDWITVMSEGNKAIVCKTSNNPAKVSTIPNWVDINYILPGVKENEFRNEFGLNGKFVLSFAGCMADSQDIEIILESAKRLIEYKDIIFLLAGNGPKYNHIVRCVGKLNLLNIKIIPVQPREKYVKLLAASDVGMVTLNPLVATPTVPSKIKSIMSAARPVLASFPLSGDAPKLINTAECGIVVEAGDTNGFCAAILKLYQNSKLCAQYGKKGREYVVRNLSIEHCAKAHEGLFVKVAAL